MNIITNILNATSIVCYISIPEIELSASVNPSIMNDVNPLDDADPWIET